MNNSVKRIFICTFWLTSVSACTTTSNSSNEAFDSLAMQADVPEDVIVYQPNQPKAVLSKLDRRHWVEIRKQTKPGHKRLYATLATGAWDAAEKDARRYLMANPRDKTGLTVLALALAMQNKFTLANYYAILIERYHGESADSLNLRGLMLVTNTKGKMSDYHKAAELFFQAFSLNPGEVASGLNLGQLYLEIGDASKAANVFADVSSRCNGCVNARIGEGVAQIRLRNFAAARANFEAVLAEHEYHPQALYRLAQISYFGENDFEKAKRYLDTLMVRVPEAENHLIRQKALALVRTLDEAGDGEYLANRGMEKTKRKPKVNQQDVVFDKNQAMSDEILKTGLGD